MYAVDPCSSGGASAPAGVRPALTLLATSLGFVVVQLDVTVVNVALERIRIALATDVAGLQWVVNAYTVAFASLLLGAGALGDRLGARRVLVLGLSVFTAASLACGLAPGLRFLIAARALQGVGAALVLPCSLAVLNSAFATSAERARAVGVWTAMGGAAVAAGPVVGGLLVGHLGWRTIFLVNLPIGLAGVWLTMRFAPETVRAARCGLDPAGQVLAVLGLGGLTVALINAGALGWRAPVVQAGAALFLAAAALFLTVEARAASPMLPLCLFRSKTFSAASIVGLLINFSFYGLIFVLSLFFQEVRGYSPLATGLAFLPMTAAVILANLAGGRLAAHVGPRLPMVVGQAVCALGYLMLLGIDAATPYASLWWRLLAVPLGIGLAVPPMTSALLSTVDRSRFGIASGVLNAVRQTGAVLGVALFGSLAAGRGGLVSGLHGALLISALALLAGCLTALLFIRSPRSRSEGDEGRG